MPVIQLADSALSYAGQAAAVATSGLQQDQARMMQQARDQEQAALQRARMAQDEEQYRVRNAMAFEQMDQRRDALRIEQMDRIGAEWTRGLEIAERLGIDPSFDHIVRLDAEIRADNPELHESLNAIWPLPESMDDPSFAPAFGRRAEVVNSLRSVKTRQSKDALWTEVQEVAEQRGLSPQEVGALEKYYNSDATDKEFASAVASVYSAANDRAVDAWALEKAKGLIAKHEDKLMPLIVGDKPNRELRDAIGRIQQGTSENPGEDAYLVGLYATGEINYVEKIKAEAIELERLRARREAGSGAAPPAGSVPPSGGPAPTQPAPSDTTGPGGGGAPPVVSRRNNPVLSQTFAAPKKSAEDQAIGKFLEAEGLGAGKTPAEYRRGFAMFVDMKLPEIGVNVTGKRTQQFYADIYDRYRESIDPTERAIARAAAFLKNNR